MKTKEWLTFQRELSGTGKFRNIFIKSALLLSIAAVSLFPARVSAASTNRSALVHIIPIREMIEPALVYVLERQVGEAEEAGADAIIFAMDTPGGAVGAAEEIISLIADVDAPTYTYVESSAISAGALIALATDQIYMAPGSKIGDAMPYQGSPMGGAAETPERINKKMESYVAGIARSTAQRNGHNPQVAEAMVVPGYELKIGDETISPEGQLLTLTNVEAARKYGPDQNPLLSSGTIDSLEQLLPRLGYENAGTYRARTSFLERLGRMIPPIASILLMAGMLGMYIELKTPGLGLPGLLGGICLLIFFWGHHIAGLAGLEDLLLFGVGVVLLMLEIFVIPGFGIAGVLGIICMVAGIFLAMAGEMPEEIPLPTLQRLEGPLIKMAIAIIGTGLGGMILGRYLPQSSIYKKLSLEESTSQEKGYSSANNMQEFLGKTGISTSALRPSGMARFDNKKLDVIAKGEFIGANENIKVVDIKGNHLYVQREDEE